MKNEKNLWILIAAIAAVVAAATTVIILIARGRYLSLTGQAICTEAAARQMRGESAEMQRVKTAARDLQKIKEDLIRQDAHEDEEEDEDMRACVPAKKKLQSVHPAEEEAEETRKVEPVTRRRRQARLQVIVGDESHKSAN